MKVIEVPRQRMPYLSVLMVGLLLIVAGLMMRSCDPEPVLTAEKSYNDQRYAKQLKEQQDQAIANSLRRVAKEKAVKYLTAEDEAIEGFWSGSGRRK